MNSCCLPSTVLALCLVLGFGVGVAATRPAQKASPPAARPAVVARTAQAVWADLMSGNRRFVAGQPKPRELVEARRRLSEGQHPHAIILGCSDSRVPPELLFDQTLGELFVVRTAGNVADPVALGTIEYAVEHLHPPLLVVLGHEKCGAVEAAASGEKMPTPNLQALVNMIAPALEPLRARASGERLVSLGIEANVRHSADDIARNSPIVRDHMIRGDLAVMRAVYQLRSGEVTRIR